jgi:maltose alpha-D-glucosyltransferase/alpha-amylase
MVTDEERDYMVRAYADDPRMRVNLGIRRRLSPLLQHDRRKIELLNALLFSLPGTPVIYYGDEIGMASNSTNSIRSQNWQVEFNGKNRSKSRPARNALPWQVSAASCAIGPFIERLGRGVLAGR